MGEASLDNWIYNASSSFESALHEIASEIDDSFCKESATEFGENAALMAYEARVAETKPASPGDPPEPA